MSVADRYQIVLAIDLRAVAREIEQADATVRFQLVAKAFDGLSMAAWSASVATVTSKPASSSALAMASASFTGLRSCPDGVIGVADDERDAGGRRLGLRHGKGG